MEEKKIDLEYLKKQDPEKYFEEVLDIDEFLELKKLVEISRGKINYYFLIEDGVVNIENREVEGIYWKGDLDLVGTTIESLWKIKKIEGNLKCSRLETLRDLGELEEIGGYCVLNRTNIESLDKLKKIGGRLDCDGAERLNDLGALEEVLGYCDFRWTKIKSLGKLKNVVGEINCNFVSTLTDIGDLEEILLLDISRTKIKTFGKLKKVRGNMFCRNIKTLNDIGKLEEIEGNLYIKGVSVEFQLKILEKYKEGSLKVKGTISFGGSTLCLDKLLEQEELHGNLDMSESNEKTLGNLKRIYGNFICDNVQLKNLGKLEKVDGELDIRENSPFLQIYALYQEKKGIIEIGTLIVDSMIGRIFNQIYHKGFFDVNEFEKVFGSNIFAIREEIVRDLAKEILLREYKGTKEGVKNRGDKIIGENQGKNLTEMQKKSIKREMIKLVREVKQISDILEIYKVVYSKKIN